MTIHYITYDVIYLRFVCDEKHILILFFVFFFLVETFFCIAIVYAEGHFYVNGYINMYLCTSDTLL